MRRVRWAGLALAMATIIALGVEALISAHRSPGEALGGGAPAALGLQLIAGLGIASAGMYLFWHGTRRGAGALLFSTGLAVFLEELPLPGASGAVLFTAGLAGGAITSALAGSAALAVPGVGRRLPDALAAGAALGVTAVVLGVLPAAVFDPRAAGCFTCPRNLLLIHSDPNTYDILVKDGLPAAAVACGLLALVIAVRAIRRPGLLRSTSTPVLVGGFGVAALGTVFFVHEARAGVPEIDPTTRALWLVQCGMLVVTTAGIALFSLRALLLRERVAGIVLATLPSPEKLRATLASTLGDPRLEIVFPRAGRATLDADGRKASRSRGDVVVSEVRRHGEVIAELRHAEWLSRSPERVVQAARGAGLALEHASLHARLRAELAELASSRVRIVEVGDAERRRLERNLHDGAQQRLIGLSMTLALMPARNAKARRGSIELQHALESLRAIAHGIHPVSLTEAGLASAVHELADESRVPMRLEIGPQQRLSPSAEIALYRLALDCLRLAERHGNGAPVTISVQTAASSARTRILMCGIDQSYLPRALEHASDRIAALSGTLTTRSSGDDVVVEASVPCGS
ncbi:MAG: sensor histidine kinase [Solirubrobacteraceae bacterium]